MTAPGTTARYFLRGDVEAEPLVDRWYAWVHLVAPATAAFVVVERHLRMMESYVRSPAMHAAAAANPATRSGPFLDLGGARVAEVRALLEATRARARHRREFVAAFAELDELLEGMTGAALEPLYPSVPAALRGLVELEYDRHHRARCRLYERLLYTGALADPSEQCLRLVRSDRDGDRPFAFSTPRLPVADGGGEGAVELAVPFAAPELDALFRARTAPADPDALADALNLDAGSRPRFRELFTAEPPRAWQGGEGTPTGSGRVRVSYFGHACVLFEDGDVSILVDPVIAYDHASDVPRLSFADLPDRIDYVLITHAHHDHVLPEALLQIRHKVGTVVVPGSDGGGLMDPSLRLVVEHLGFPDVREVRELDVVRLPNGAITAVPFVGEHHDLAIRSKTTYHLRLGGRTVLVGADTANVNPAVYERVHDLVGDIDLLFLGMECEGAPASWVYGPYFARPLDRDHDQGRRGRASTSQEALDVVERFDGAEVYVYAMGEEPWLYPLLGIPYTTESFPLQEAERLVKSCQAQGRHAERLYGAKRWSWS
ncbi:MBL fold metallo-hydrolase [Streptomyces mobaraensis]|uniref:MBL fold metallo-hydrolase n=1 Tax=Streptomyces mobaraensis TaxID=35621 RepID=A0A5N5W9N3_STRMB|nr:MBL fold metallo-hydrolase [Streptomyces mobaraensis]KAB7846938.1 MBL fold metallo-hydrolase [Streptomyces mobaraensis]